MIELKREDGGSFYGKAWVRDTLEGETLVSYGTDICTVDIDGCFTKLWSGWSATTARHINAFRQQYGDWELATDTKLSKKEWEEMETIV